MFVCPPIPPSPQTVSDGAVCLDKIQFLEEKSGFVCLKYVSNWFLREYS